MFLNCSLKHLKQNEPDWFQRIMDDAQDELPEWNEEFLNAQRSISSNHEALLDDGHQIKENCFIRFVHLPEEDKQLSFPNHDQIGFFTEVKGVVVRVTDTKLLEMQRDFECTICHEVVEELAEFGLNFKFEVPKSCSTTKCKGTMRPKRIRPPPEYCVQHQEIKIQVNTDIN